MDMIMREKTNAGDSVSLGQDTGVVAESHSATKKANEEPNLDRFASLIRSSARSVSGERDDEDEDDDIISVTGFNNEIG